MVSPDLIKLLSLGRVEASFTLLSFSRSFLPEPIAKIRKSLGRKTLLVEKMNAMQYCNITRCYPRKQYASAAACSCRHPTSCRSIPATYQ